MQCTQSVDNTRVMSYIFITLLCNNYFPQKFITHKDLLESLLHSFPSSPAVVCGGLWWSVVFRPTRDELRRSKQVLKRREQRSHAGSSCDHCPYFV